MIASLPMYGSARTREAEARLWHCIRDALRRCGLPAPDDLTDNPGNLMAHWRRPDLILSQTCGLPYRTLLKDHVTLIGTPDYALPGCPPGFYNSVVIARADDPRTTLAEYGSARFAYNAAHSQSGWAALANDAPEVLQGPRTKTGSHRSSAQAVRAGSADFASIDAMTWHLLEAETATDGLRVLTRTTPTPGLPLITARQFDGAMIFDQVSSAIDNLAAADRDRLGIAGLVHIPSAVYCALPIPPAPG